MSADQSIIDLTNETQEELQNENQDDIEIVGQKCSGNDEPIIYCNQSTTQASRPTKRRRTSNHQAPEEEEDVLEIVAAPPTQRARLGSSHNRRHVNRAGRTSSNEPESLSASIPVSLPVSVERSAQDAVQTPARPAVNVQNLPPAAPIISPGFECPICLEKHKDNLVSTICGHIFCKPCLKESMKTVKQCPKCRKKITVKSFHNIFI